MIFVFINRLFTIFESNAIFADFSHFTINTIVDKKNLLERMFNFIMY